MICIKVEIRHDLFIIDLLAVLLLGVVYFFPGSVVRVVLGLFFVLFFPGYVLISALFPEKDDLDGIERFALSFGLSIAVVPLIGLALNFTPWGIRLFPILVSLIGFVFLMSFVAYFRRNNVPEVDRFLVAFEFGFSKEGGYSRLDKALTIILVLSILVAVFALVYVIVTPKKGERFTEFYVLGPGRMAEGYPSNMSLGDTSSLVVGVVNHEYEVVRYDLVVTLEGGSLFSLEEEGFGFDLGHNETREIDFVFEPQQRGRDMRLEFLLYKNQNFTGPYRDLHLWVSVE